MAAKQTLVRLLAEAAESVPLAAFRVRFWDGDHFETGPGSPEFTLTFRSAHALRRTLATGFLGFGEGYMDGDIEVEGDWERLFAVAAASPLATRRLPPLAALRFFGYRITTRDTHGRSRRNIVQHYDLGNDFYRLWLDETMTYSCGYFRSPTASLAEAQRDKLELICRKLRLAPGMRLLDVGCGWGSLLIHAARHHGVMAVGCTLSPSQAELAAARVREAGLQKRVEVRLEDYRDVPGTYDRWVSVGMFEHVGKHFMVPFARRIARQLRPGGVGLLHFIGKDRVGPGDPWTLRYIFPGGYLPALPEVLRAIGRSGLVTIDVENLRAHYVLTLQQWRRRFELHSTNLARRFDERFVRMWRLFLASSAAGFAHLESRLYQVLFSNGLSAEIPATREDLYGELTARRSAAS